MKNDPLIADLEASDLNEVRRRLAAGEWGQATNPLYCKVSEWINVRSAAIRDTRDEEAIRIAREANSLAEKANNIALSAAVSASNANATSRSALRTAWVAAIAAIVVAIFAAIPVIISIIEK